MTCIEFQHWLDEGRPRRSPTNDHAAICLRCERELRAAVEVERLLAIVVPAEVGAGFNDAVLRQVRSNNRRRGRALTVVVQVMAEPIVTLSLALAMVMAWQYRIFAMAVAGASNRVALAIERLSRSEMGTVGGTGVIKLFGTPEVAIGLAIAIAPLIVWVSWRVFRKYEEMTLPHWFSGRPPEA